jgi:phage gp36-like protein
VPPSYLTVDEFRVHTIMPDEQIESLETVKPGWLGAQLESSSRWCDSYLAKRYAVPFPAPYPEAVKSWLVRMVTLRAAMAHGYPASDEQRALYIADADKAEEEVKQAADGNLGLIDLAPSDQSAARVQFGGPLAYAESSPYVSKDVQRDRARREDFNRRGS